MKTKLFLIVCLLGQKAFSQVAVVETVTVPQVVNTAIAPQNNFTLVTSYNHMDLNKNYYKGALDVSDMDRVIPYREKYSYNEFTDGNVIYSSGNQSQLLKMNYHQLYEEMQFIDGKGDTLFIANADSIAFVRFDKYLYQHSSETGYLKILSGNHETKLGLQEQLKWMELSKTSNIQINTPYEHIVLSKNKSYYLITDSNESWLATKSGFLNAFPTHTKKIKTYMRQMARQGHSIKFSNEEDLVKLMKFCESLSKQS